MRHVHPPMVKGGRSGFDSGWALATLERKLWGLAAECIGPGAPSASVARDGRTALSCRVMATPPRDTQDRLLEDGRAALREGAWESARSSLLAHLDIAPDCPEAWEGLGTACYWLQDSELLLEARRQAYGHYCAEGDLRSAARVATWLAGDHLEIRAEAAVAAGWLERARQLLERVEPSVEHALVRTMEAHLALMAHGDTARALKVAAEAREIALRVGGTDQEILARASEGLALVLSGRVQDGLRSLDAAAAAAFGGEVDDLDALAITCCYVIQGCERVRDYPRAMQWCGRFEELSARLHLDKFLTFCRVQHGTLLVWQGRWPEAEAKLTAARDDMQRARRSVPTAALVRLGELRRRQGRWDEAAALLDEARTHPRAAISRAALALDRGDAATAEDLAAQALRRTSATSDTERLGALEVLVLARLARGAVEEAEAAQRQLEEAAALVRTAPVRAAAMFTAGILALEAGRGEEARRQLQDAADLYERGDSPYEAANARLELARALDVLGRRRDARIQARQALEVHERLGAERAAGRARAWLGGIETRRGASSTCGTQASLTARQAEVLRLVARGLSNRSIGARLSLSEFTVRRHLANAYLRLGVSSRAAAVAQALRDGLI